MPGKSGVGLTVDRPFTIGDAVEVRFPKVVGWDRHTPVADVVNFTALPGRLTNGTLVDEMLFGEVHEKVNPATVLETDLVPPDSLRPVRGEQWKSMTSVYGRFDLARLFGRPGDSVAFAHVYLYSPKPQVVQIWLGSADKGKIYVNGKHLFTSPKSHPPFLDSEKVTGVALNQGWNSLAVELLSAPRGGWGCSVRIMDELGQPTRQISYQADGPANVASP